MSSLAATQADGYYIPPSALDSNQHKKKSRNQIAGSNGHNQYLLRSVVRFELPYDGFCLTCNAHVGKGTRFNAHKAEVGAYYTSKIWEFTTKCRACAKSVFKIRNNPKERGFDYVEGIRKKVEEFDTAEAGTEGVIDTDVGRGIVPHSATTTADDGGKEPPPPSDDPLGRLEKRAAGKRLAMTERDAMVALIKGNAATMYDDAASNADLRSTLRRERKAKKRRLHDARGAGLGRGIELGEVTADDRRRAREAFGDGMVADRKSRVREKEAFRDLRGGSIFGSGGKSSGGRKGRSSVGVPLTRNVRDQSADCRETKMQTSERDDGKKKKFLVSHSTGAPLERDADVGRVPPIDTHKNSSLGDQISCITSEKHAEKEAVGLSNAREEVGAAVATSLSALMAYDSESD